MPAYDWFQETQYKWGSIDEMTCAPNRGQADNKFMLVNHWVGFQPPDPGRTGSQVNSTDTLTARIEQCLADRGVWPNVVAVDFAERGALMKVVASYNAEVRDRIGGLSSRSSEEVAPTTSTDGATRPTDTLPESTSSGFGTPTVLGSLTGGVPDQFCAAAGPFVDLMSGWALADLAKPAAAGGRPALVYGPAMDQAIRDIEPISPDELVQQLRAAAAQAAAAVAALRQAGLQQTDIDAMVAAFRDQAGSGIPDPAVAEDRAQKVVDGRLGRATALALAAAFDRTDPTLPAVFDLGEVSDDVATSSGYGCLIRG
jgi:hypothetical protein